MHNEFNAENKQHIKELFEQQTGVKIAGEGEGFKDVKVRKTGAWRTGRGIIAAACACIVVVAGVGIASRTGFGTGMFMMGGSAPDANAPAMAADIAVSDAPASAIAADREIEEAVPAEAPEAPAAAPPESMGSAGIKDCPAEPEADPDGYAYQMWCIPGGLSEAESFELLWKDMGDMSEEELYACGPGEQCVLVEIFAGERRGFNRYDGEDGVTAIDAWLAGLPDELRYEDEAQAKSAGEYIKVIFASADESGRITLDVYFTDAAAWVVN